MNRVERKMMEGMHGHPGKGDHDRINLKKFQDGWDYWHKNEAKAKKDKPLTNSPTKV